MASDTVTQIKERLSIVDIVAPYVELHKAGKHLKGRSPFTNERTPSFFVSPERGMYYCFSTHKGGDMFTFVQEMEGVDFKGALKMLAERAGVELVPEDPKKKTERDTQYAIVEAATSFFQTKLQELPSALSYLEKRGITKDTREKWRIGYAPGPPQYGWRELRSYLTEQGHTDVVMKTAGLIKGGEEGKEPFDVFRDRIMFPISDPSGRVIAFSGRILTPDSDAPKYVNSPDTMLFDKSEALYGYDKAKHGIRHYDFSLIVEGQFDVVLAHQAGYTNAVAVSGTALTSHHVSLLSRLSQKVVLALDADRAGIAAVKRGAELMLVQGMDVKVAMLPEGQDPADIVQDNPKQFREYIGKSVHVIEFLLHILKQQSKDERGFKLRTREEILPFLLYIENRIDREHFEEVIAKALNTTRDAIHIEAQRIEESRRHIKINSSESGAEPRVEGDAIRNTQKRKDALLEYLAAITEVLPVDIRETFCELFMEASGGLSVADVKQGIAPSVLSEYVFTAEIHFNSMRTSMVAEELVHTLSELATLMVKDAIAIKKEELRIAEETGDDAGAHACVVALNELQRRLGAVQFLPERLLQRG